MGDGVLGEGSVTVEGSGLGEVSVTVVGVSVSTGRDRF